MQHLPFALLSPALGTAYSAAWQLALIQIQELVWRQGLASNVYPVQGSHTGNPAPGQPRV